MYLAGTDPRHPLASPLFGDPAGLPPLAIHVGSTEVLLSDATRYAERARDAGVFVSLKVWDRMSHIFYLLARMQPEGRQVLQAVGEFARERWAVPETVDVSAGQ